MNKKEKAAAKAAASQAGGEQTEQVDEFVFAKQAYLAYGEVTDFKNFQGEPMPKFEELPERIQNAWKAAAASLIPDTEEVATVNIDAVSMLQRAIPLMGYLAHQAPQGAGPDVHKWLDDAGKFQFDETVIADS